MATHSLFSPSSSHRWLKCPASITMSQKLPKHASDDVNEAALEGSAVHALAEMALVDNVKTEHWLDAVFQGNSFGEYDETEPHVMINQDNVNHVDQYVHYVNQFQGETEIEKSVDYSSHAKNGFGTSDVINIEGNVLRIIDLKYGKENFVDVVNNTQLMLYALGALDDMLFCDDHHVVFDVELTIYQPRMNNIASWNISPFVIYQFGDIVKEASENALSDNPRFNPSAETCRYCPARPICRPYYTLIVNSMCVEDVSLMRSDEIAKVLTDKSAVTSYLETVEKFALNRALLGDILPGLKLVEGRRNRTWRNTESVESILVKHLGDAAYKKALISPAQAIKLCGEPELHDHIYKPTGDAKVAPLHDRRKSIIDIESYNKNNFEIIDD